MKSKKLKIAAIIISSFLLVTIILSFIYVDNKTIDYENFTVDGIVGAADMKIAHLSDLHFPKVKVDTEKLIDRLVEEKPDIIAVTGDLIDRDCASLTQSGAVRFIEAIKNIAPVFYVNGNHETDNYEVAGALYAALLNNGVIILNNTTVNINIKGVEIIMIGLSDNTDYNESIFNGNSAAESSYKILLAHRPEKWPNYTSATNTLRPNLILTGHVHGGQFRFFGKGFIAPSQGFFPKYDSGLYKTEDGNSTMIVSRGIGSSIIPFRFNNKPHVPIITVKG